MVDFETFATYMGEFCGRNSVRLEEDRLRKFWIYLKELLRWNRVHNLTAVRDWRENVRRNFCDSLTLVVFFEKIGFPIEGKSLVDVGSGAGFPGVPLKIYYGDRLEVHLVESVSKKCSFLSYLKARLGLDYTVHCTMAEGLGQKFNVAVARALEVKGKKVSPLHYADRLLTNLAEDLTVIMKGKEIDGEEAKALGYAIFELDLPDFKGMKLLYKFLRGRNL